MRSQLRSIQIRWLLDILQSSDQHDGSFFLQTLVLCPSPKDQASLEKSDFLFTVQKAMATMTLQSKDHGELLDVIDHLRSQGLSSYVSLPQLVVCGDQSAGKSSVLEAISGIAFPTKDNLCTRFATELILRRDLNNGVTITIIPDGDRSEQEKEDLRRFKAPTSNLEEFPSLVDASKEAMGFNQSVKAFSKDILRVEISGPEQPHLTLVDLPGLIHAESKQQTAEDVELVASLVQNYMSNPRSIMLAVVSAKNDYANQIVTKFARDVDPEGLRTLGIITKPDTLHTGSESERAFLDLARNNEVNFRLGWHVLRNRDFDTKHWGRDERDSQEQDFFLKGVWQTLPLDVLGVGTLRPRLSSVLKDQIVSELPNLIRDVEGGIAECQRTLRRLGEARGTVSEQRLYLVRVSQTFSSLLTSATYGTYSQEFFGDPRTESGYNKRLRAVTQGMLLKFTEAMRVEGHFQHIVEEEDATDGNTHPRRIVRSDFIGEVAELMRRTRGRELPGTFNPMIIGELFYYQSQPWRHLVQKYSDDLVAAARMTVELTLTQAADGTTAERLLREIVNPALENCIERLRVKTEEIMRPHQQGHPITYNHYFIETIQKSRKEHVKKEQRKILHSFFGDRTRNGYRAYDQGSIDLERLLEALNVDAGSNMDHFACSEATFCMEAYYKVIILQSIRHHS